MAARGTVRAQAHPALACEVEGDLRKRGVAKLLVQPLQLWPRACRQRLFSDSLYLCKPAISKAGRAAQGVQLTEGAPRLYRV